jgi:hypothetical protein
MILLTSASRVPGITDVSHYTWPEGGEFRRVSLSFCIGRGRPGGREEGRGRGRERERERERENLAVAGVGLSVLKTRILRIDKLFRNY